MMGHMLSAPQSKEKTGTHGVVAGLAHRVSAEEPRAAGLSGATRRCVGPSPRAEMSVSRECSSSGLCWKKRMLEEDALYPA